MEQGERFGQFRITRRLGQGAMGSVYLATDLEDFRHVALKVLSPSAMSRPELKAAFFEEAKLSLSLSHPNLVACLSAGLTDDPPWIAFEYVTGTSLGELLEQKGALPAGEALNLLLDIAYGLAAAHQKGILHRDLKPENILVTPNGTVKLIDFSAAESSDGPRSHGGTPTYASPEQLQGKEIDTTSDLYSLGLVLYEMLTGRRLLESGSLPEIVFQQTHLAERMTPPSALDDSCPMVLDDFIRGLLAFQPAYRLYRSAVDLAENLESILAEAGEETARRRTQRNLARLELAETDFCSSLNLLAAGKFDQGLAHLRSLAAQSEAVLANYRPRIIEALRTLLFDLWAMEGQDSSPAATRSMLSALIKVATIARQLDCDDLCLVIEHRFAHCAAGLPDEEQQRQACSSLLAALSWSMVVGSRSLLLAHRAKDAQGCAAAYLPLARAFLRAGAFEKARALALEALHRTRAKKQASEILCEVVARKQQFESDRAGFLSIANVLAKSGNAAGATNACRKHLSEYPFDIPIWERLAELQLRLGRSSEGKASLFVAARSAMSRSEMGLARRVLSRLLCVAPEDPWAFALLFEVLHAENRLPEGFHTQGRLKIAILCKEGVDTAAALILEKEFCGDISEIPFLEALDALARETRCGTVLARINVELGRYALEGAFRDEAREYFIEALENSPDPLPLLERIRSLTASSKLFTSYELMTLRGCLAPRTRPSAKLTDLRGSRDDTLHGNAS